MHDESEVVIVVGDGGGHAAGDGALVARGMDAGFRLAGIHGHFWQLLV